ncbi:unnamed protein product [Danaus chrysippus]|uniref:(African queen) hypothetical protein n=1 Tax=Danaus chrysippus TaxID=151541 RepID=A0A8J2M837_9NEOP|nr:unnamed protein product [Danaus chrysippus]
MSLKFFLILFIVSAADSINRPVYKIVLAQKGYTQFLQYDIETPPIREFTFCTWIRVSDFSNDQSLFTYVANGNNRLVRLWLDTGGKHINVAINDKKSSSVFVNMTSDIWRHVCFSYQSDYGAWALYLDGRLAHCETAQSLYGYVLPAGGSVIIGYGTGANGTPNGFEGEVFGVNMILTSTIERNYTIKRDPHYRQKGFRKNRVDPNSNIKYIVLDHETMEESTSTTRPQNSFFINKNNNFGKTKHPYTLTEHGDKYHGSDETTETTDFSNEKEIIDLPPNNKKRLDTDNDHISFWNLVNSAGRVERKKIKSTELFSSDTKDLSPVSQFETPPPPISFHFKPRQPSQMSFYDLNENKTGINKKSLPSSKGYEAPEINVQPTPDKNHKVYGQWTSSKFANNVLNYIKKANLKHREQKKIPSTIPLLKLTDSFPYTSEFKMSKVRPQHIFQKRKFIDTHSIKKRGIYPPRNVKNYIMEDHTRRQPKFIKVTNKGEVDQSSEQRYYRNVDSHVYSKKIFSTKFGKTQSFPMTSKVNKNLPSFDLYKTSNLMTILPFLKSSEYFVDEYDKIKSTSGNDVNTKSLSDGNKWHNVMSYNNDYTPRKIDVKSGKITPNNDIDGRIADANKRNPSLRLKYMPDNHKVVKNVDDDAIMEGRALALEISNSSDTKSNSVSILKYNHGYLPNQQNQQNLNNKILNSNLDLDQMTFDQRVKIGSTLNERQAIGSNMRQMKESSEEGDENISNVNRYKSSSENVSIPPPQGSKICKNVELFDRFFYIQPDGSVDVTDIISPVKEKNVAIAFIVQNYKKCSTKDSEFETNPLLFIEWTKTPVRLFGGAYSKRTTDLCGFF